MKKFILLILLISLMFTCQAQSARILKNVVDKESRDYKRAMIYGIFVQRLGFKSGGFPQYVKVYNFDQNKEYRLRVKDAFTAQKNSLFCAELPLGMYELRSYIYIQSKWYGGKEFEEQLYKNIDCSDSVKYKAAVDSLGLSSFKRFSFTVNEISPYYVGQWEFGTGLVSFSSDKQTSDEKLKRLIHVSDGSKAISILPQ
jgi:hypothetical protein